MDVPNPSAKKILVPCQDVLSELGLSVQCLGEKRKKKKKKLFLSTCVTIPSGFLLFHLYISDHYLALIISIQTIRAVA